MGSGGFRVGLVLVGSLVVLSLIPTLHEPNEMVDPAASRHLPPASRLLEVRLTSGEPLLATGIEVLGDTVEIERPRGQRRTVPKAAVTNLQDGRIDDYRTFPLGTDNLGRDVWSRIIIGARVSLIIGLVAMLLALVLGTTLGAVAALSGPTVDALLMRLVDAYLAFPQLFLIIGLAAIFQPSTWMVILLLGATSWMPVCRMARAEIRGLQHREFVQASRGLGQTGFLILWRHLLPNALTPLIVEASLLVGDMILAEAALSYFGLGVQPPTPSWGNMISEGRASLGLAWWISAFPGIALALTVIGFNLLGDSLRDRLDPQHGEADP
jgi:peptide/nickel transport system permease protein